MICADFEQLLDGFIDSELPPQMLLEVARHAAACPSCDQTARELTTMHDALARVASDDAATLDLSGVWPAVAVEFDRAQARRAWRRRLRSAPVWMTAMAAAASVAIWIRSPEVLPVPVSSAPVRATRVAMRRPTNRAVIDRLAGKGVTVRREPKAGTTIIWVNNSPGLDNPSGMSTSGITNVSETVR
jgi:anti-sigma factor RsiW